MTLVPKNLASWSTDNVNELADVVNTLAQAAADVAPDGVTLDASGPGGTLEIKNGGVTEGKITLADVTTLNVGATKHGLVPKTPADATKYLDGTGAWSTPVTGASTKSVTQTAHGLVVGNAVRFNGTNWVKSLADAAANADVDGLVSAVADVDHFTASLGGDVTGMAGLVAGTDYFLDPVTAGALTSTEPSTPGQVSVPVVKAISTTESVFRPLRGLVIPAKTLITIPIILIADATALPSVVDDAFSYTYIVPSYLNGYTLVAGAPSGTIPTTTWIIKTAATGTIPQLALRKNAATEMLSTTLHIDLNELTSDTAVTAAVAAGGGAATVATGDAIHFDIDATDAAARGSTIHMTFVAP